MSNILSQKVSMAEKVGYGLGDFLAPNDPGRAAWAELRKQQAKAAQESPYVTLIKNSDTGEWNDIHPLDKKTPATRLVEAVIQNEKQNK